MSINDLKKIQVTLKHGDYYAFWRILNIVIIGILLASILFCLYFIYQNIELALTNTNAAIGMQPNLAYDTLDIKSYEKAKKNIDEKNTLPIIPDKLRNIFTYSQSTTTYERATTTTQTTSATSTTSTPQ